VRLLLTSGKSVKVLARELGTSHVSLLNWKAEALHNGDFPQGAKPEGVRGNYAVLEQENIRLKISSPGKLHHFGLVFASALQGACRRAPATGAEKCKKVSNPATHSVLDRSYRRGSNCARSRCSVVACSLWPHNSPKSLFRSRKVIKCHQMSLSPDPQPFPPSALNHQLSTSCRLLGQKAKFPDIT
jgi:hypothetical protein